MLRCVSTCRRCAATLAVVSALAAGVRGEDGATPSPAAEVHSLIRKYCWDCHAEGAAEGNRSFDTYASREELFADRTLWWSALKNVRADIMPPRDADRPSDDEKREITDWIKQSVFKIDPADPDPGRVTIRRLNREEYRNTIRDLMGVDYDTAVEFPPDDSGHGFDNMGAVLSLSPLLMEKYLQAAEAIVEDAVPRVARVMPVETYGGDRWRSADRETDGGSLDFYTAAVVRRDIDIDATAEYRLVFDVTVNGGFDFDPGRCRLVCRIDDEELWSQEFGWGDDRSRSIEKTVRLKQGERDIEFALTPLTPPEEKKHDIRLRVRRVRVEGPLDPESWEVPEQYARFFTRPTPPPPDDEAARTEYTRELLSSFALRAFRRPVDEATLNRLVAFAREVDHSQDRGFEDSIAQAMTAILASPRFLFRFEQSSPPGEGSRFPLVDEFALASRLSYFFWSTMPDGELLDLAARGELRKNLDAQVARMLADERSDRLIRNFVGQWLQTRDVEGASIDPLSALGFRQEYDELRELFYRSGRFRSREPQPDEPPEITKARERIRELRDLREKWDEELRRDMRRETEMLVEHVIKEDRPLVELLDCDYTFLSERLARHYGIEGVDGDEMRRVSLPDDSPRGGLLTQGTFLIVTSNPTRTSPVKRGLFILDNILGTPAPPAPAVVPELEASQAKISDHEPTLREALELHRSEPLCSSCHARFDPLGLALENFNAMAMWRDTEAGRPIDPTGQLITGETFSSLAELKDILKKQRRLDFYRCVTERLLTYALGRGIEPEDEETVDQLVSQVDASGGRCSALFRGIVRSAPFQRMRPPGADEAPVAATSSSSE